MAMTLKVYAPKAVEADPRQYWTQHMAATYLGQPTGFTEAVKVIVPSLRFHQGQRM
jgi:hypothetical protein